MESISPAEELELFQLIGDAQTTNYLAAHCSFEHISTFREEVCGLWRLHGDKLIFQQVNYVWKGRLSLWSVLYVWVCTILFQRSLLTTLDPLFHFNCVMCGRNLCGKFHQLMFREMKSSHAEMVTCTVVTMSVDFIMVLRPILSGCYSLTVPRLFTFYAIPYFLMANLMFFMTLYKCAQHLLGTGFARMPIITLFLRHRVKHSYGGPSLGVLPETLHQSSLEVLHAQSLHWSACQALPSKSLYFSAGGFWYCSCHQISVRGVAVIAITASSSPDLGPLRGFPFIYLTLGVREMRSHPVRIVLSLRRTRSIPSPGRARSSIRICAHTARRSILLTRLPSPTLAPGLAVRMVTVRVARIYAPLIGHAPLFPGRGSSRPDPARTPVPRVRDTPPLLPTRAPGSCPQDIHCALQAFRCMAHRHPALVPVPGTLLRAGCIHAVRTVRRAGTLYGPRGLENCGIVDMHRTAKGTVANTKIGASGKAGCSAGNEDTSEPQDGGTKGDLR
ncbi:hypothetical protein C8R44DRAFT_860436 [Mycena epipterygia]|nr:hypothetical protein C8R44DRAFT_860436 [Mycena epipterygia]